MDENTNVRNLMTQLLEELGLDLSPNNDKLTSFKVSQSGHKAKIEGWGWKLILELNGKCHTYNGVNSYLSDPEVHWYLELNFVSPLDQPVRNLSHLHKVIEILDAKRAKK